MELYVDKDTIKDLEIFDSFKNEQSIFHIFNYTQTIGGKIRLEKMLGKPFADLRQINERKEAIRFFQENQLQTNFDKNDLDFIEHYMNQNKRPSKASWISAIEKNIRNRIKSNSEYYIIERGVDYTIFTLNSFREFILQLDKTDCPALIRNLNQHLLDLFSKKEFEPIIHIENLKKLSPIEISTYDYLFRAKYKPQLETIIDIIYEYDVFQAVAQAAREYHFTYPELLPCDEQKLDIRGLFHPFVKNPVCNDICLTRSDNLCFITGPNMAGKSTFLKSVGVATYLAHMGFPVPADKMSISLLSGISTTINITDNLNLGYSHFYSEVLRIKNVAMEMKKHKHMLVIFDELFRGTNVKDASDASTAVISALSENTSCFYFISSHIIEIASELEKANNIQFACFNVENNNEMPSYTYKLKKGISDTRLGMYIIQREKVLEIIHDANKNP